MERFKLMPLTVEYTEYLEKKYKTTFLHGATVLAIAIGLKTVEINGLIYFACAFSTSIILN